MNCKVSVVAGRATADFRALAQGEMAVNPGTIESGVLFAPRERGPPAIVEAA
jgi:hypothetical protein